MQETKTAKITITNPDIKIILKQNIAKYPDFPKKGILYQDLNPIYSNPDTFNMLIDTMQLKANQLGTFDFILGIEARGFILGSALAHRLKIGFVPVRKKGKLPGKVHSIEYDLEYGKDCLEIQHDLNLKDKRLLVIDDVFATGGTLKAVLNLLDKITEQVAFGVILDIGLSNIKALNKKHFVVIENE